MTNMSDAGVVVDSTPAMTQSHQIMLHNFDDNNNEVSSMKDKKKKNRRSRRSKQISSLSASMPGMDEPNCEAMAGSSKLNCEGSNGDLESHEVVSADMVRNLSPDLVDRESVGYTFKDAAPYHSNGFHTRRKYFAPHLSEDEISNQLEKGNIFRALFRVNAHNRVEAYCKIEGVQTDVFINGLVAQNRAIEGDIVAIEVDPPSLWTRMKGVTGATNCSPVDDCSSHPEAVNLAQNRFKGKKELDLEYECVEDGVYHGNQSSSGEINGNPSGSLDGCYINGGHFAVSDPSGATCSVVENHIFDAVENLSAFVDACPSKRPTGRVVGIIERSTRRKTIVGFLNVKQWVLSRDYNKKDCKQKRQLSALNGQYILLTPTDARFPRMLITVKSLPDSIKKRLLASDATVEMDLVAAQIVDWGEESCLPKAHVMHAFGRGGSIAAQIAAILFENAIDGSEFSSEVLSCLPSLSWEIPPEEYGSRRDYRKLCVFTIDPASATDLDDALSIEKLSNGNYRVGVHIADVSYFVQPDTALDIDAQIRSTSVYLLQSKLPMLPPLLSENFGSLNPGVDRLAFSILWEIDTSGNILDRWIGRSVIRSCCKLSYEHAQDIVDMVVDPRSGNAPLSYWPKLYGDFEWSDVITSVRCLYEISRTLKDNRFNRGALSLESPKISFSFDEDGIPYDSMLCGRKDSNLLVEEFMLLANRTAAEVITNAYPSCALLRRHPEPNARKLRGFEAFCSKLGLELDTSSSSQLHQSLERIRDEGNSCPMLFDILMSYAVKPMQLAAYFCSGDLKERENGWGHYALAVPVYTHFTSPLRRYPDIVVHRTLAATIEAERIYLERKNSVLSLSENGVKDIRCFTGLCVDEDAMGSAEAQEALALAATMYSVPCTDILAGVASHCNERKLASRHVKDAIERLYMWTLLKKKEVLFSEASVLGLGPKFISIYIWKLAIERRIYYDEVEGLTVEWLDATSVLVLSQPINRRLFRKASAIKSRTLEDVALVISPEESEYALHLFDQIGKENSGLDVGVDVSNSCRSDVSNVEPAVFPLTVRLLSKIPVALHAIGGDDGPLDIGVRLYVSSYLK